MSVTSYAAASPPSCCARRRRKTSPHATRCVSGGCCSARRSRGTPCSARERRPQVAAPAPGRMAPGRARPPARSGPSCVELRVRGFDQELIRHGRGGHELHDVLGAVHPCVASGDHAPNPHTPTQSSPRLRHWSPPPVRAALADLLRVEEGADLAFAECWVVTRPPPIFRLPDRARRDALVGHVIPLRRVARVQVPEPSGDVGVCTESCGPWRRTTPGRA